ncbi:MAG: exodeoxyribonuclease V subunit gamma [Pseudomonadota bacterium]
MTHPSLIPGLILVHGNHPEMLRDLLVEWMKRYPLAPLENEIILVQSNGIAQWLKLAIAADAGAGIGQGGGCGIAAALEFLLPGRFLWRAYRDVLGHEAVPETSPFDKSRLVWRLMRLLPEILSLPEYAPLQRFLDQDGDRRKRFQLAQRLADLFDQYQVYRADWLSAWAAGQDILIQARGEPLALTEDQRWQASLWRALLADVKTAGEKAGTTKNPGRAAVHEAFLRQVAQCRLSENQRPAGLPRRVMVFGISALPRQSMEVLVNLARWTQVLMCVHNPCEHYWADIVADKNLLLAEQARQRRRQGAPAVLSEELLHLHAHPLLAAWGQQGRDFIGLLDEHDSPEARERYLPRFAEIQQRIDLFDSHGDATLLQQLQEDIRELRPLRETREHWPAVDAVRDDSIRFHSAHSPQREVEILHDRLLAAFNADTSLCPRDILVMVPTIDTYAPHIQAVFGLVDKPEPQQDPRYIPFSLADQGRRQADPLLKALQQLLALPQSRFAVSDLLDLLEVPALRQRFGILEADLPLLHRWIRGANIRWGLHTGQRASLGLPEQANNTWQFGLRRMLLGYAVGADASPWREIEPYDEIGGLDAALLGPLVDLLDRLEAAWQTLREAATVNLWCERLRALMADFFAADDDSDDAYTLSQLETLLQRWRGACDEARLSEALPLAVVGEHWLSQLDDGGLAQRFFAGCVTFATLMPMRAIPFRHVCLLGMNDGEYPRARIPMDFDLMGGDYRPGDRSRREDDRYLFLEALLSARECLHISWVGRSIHDNSPRPPSVLVGQLRDHLAAGWRLAGEEGRSADQTGTALLNAITLNHPLQPFSPLYFPLDPDCSPFFTYAHEWRAGEPPDQAGPADTRLPLLPRETPLRVRDLGDFLKEPVKAFFRKRLKVTFEQEDPTSEDQEPFTLNGLERWHLQDEIIQAQAIALGQDQDLVSACHARLARIQRRGELATGGFGQVMGQMLVEPMEELFERYQTERVRWPEVIAAEEEIRFQAEMAGQTLEIADWLGGFRSNAEGERGRVILETSDLVDRDNHYRGDKLIRHWVAHLAAHLAGGPLTTVVVSKKGHVELKPLEDHEARGHLTQLLSAWQEGMCRPLPLAAKTAFVWLSTHNEAEARKSYEGGFMKRGEIEDCAYLQRAYPDFDALNASEEFARLAETLLRPLHLALFADPETGVEKTRAKKATGAAP